MKESKDSKEPSKKPAEPAKAAEPAGNKPSGDKPSGDKPAGDKTYVGGAAAVDPNIKRDFRGSEGHKIVDPEFAKDPTQGPDPSVGPQAGKAPGLKTLDPKFPQDKTQGPDPSVGPEKNAAPAAVASPGPDPKQAAGKTHFEKIRAELLAHRFDAAFKIAEEVFEADPSPTNLKSLPRQLTAGSNGLPPSEELLKALQDSAAKRQDSPWAAAVLADALAAAGRHDESLAASEKLVKAPKKYGWLRFQRGLVLLETKGEYDAAAAEFRAALESVPGFWDAAAYLAEIELCKGDAAAAFKSFDKLIAPLNGFDKAQAMAWRGRLRLWNGEYEKAVADFEPIAPATILEMIKREKNFLAPFALCWRGAAKLLLGKTDEALKDLDAYAASNRFDREALVWRGEALRKAGRVDEALSVLDSALERREFDFWALANRALARLKKKDAAGAAEDWDMIPESTRAAFAKAAGVSADGGPDERAKALEAGLKRGRGVRRPDQYLAPLWARG